MNSIFTKITRNFNALSNVGSAGNTARSAYRSAAITGALLTAFSCNVFANRPAMEESSPMMHEPEAPVPTNPILTEPTANETRPQPQAPSAVESMMQRQNHLPQQTGDVLQLPATEMQPGETLKVRLLDSPRRGMSMDRVQQEYGQPMATSESIGQPPITHWTYSDRVVYFEYSTVLHVVAR